MATGPTGSPRGSMASMVLVSNERRTDMKMVTQKDLARFTSLENKLDEIKAQYLAMKERLMAALEDGAGVETGDRIAKLEQIERRSVSWKDVVIRLKGEGYTKQVLAGTKPTFYFKLVVK